MSAPKAAEWHKYLNDIRRYLNIIPHRNIETIRPFICCTYARIKENVSIRELIDKELVSIF